MRKLINYIVMAVLSLAFIGIGAWAFGQGMYNDKIRKYFYEKKISNLQELVSQPSEESQLVLVRGNINAKEVFLSKDNEEVVLEYYKEEIARDKDGNRWKLLKDTKFFKVIPFRINADNQEALVDAYGLDPTFLAKNVEKLNQGDNDKLKRITSTTLKPNQEVYILGNFQNKSGQLFISSPGLYQSVFTPFWRKEPFIITTLPPNTVSAKAKTIGQSIYLVSLALLIAGVFFLITSVKNIFQNLRLKDGSDDYLE